MESHRTCLGSEKGFWKAKQCVFPPELALFWWPCSVVFAVFSSRYYGRFRFRKIEQHGILYRRAGCHGRVHINLRCSKRMDPFGSPGDFSTAHWLTSKGYLVQ